MGIWNKENITGAIIQRIIFNDREVESASTGEKVNLDIGAKDGSRIYLTSSPRIKIEPDFKIKRSPLNTASRSPVRVIFPRIIKQKAPPLQQFMAKAYSLAEVKEIAKAEADIVFYDIFAPDFPDPGEWNERAILGAYLPRIMNDVELLTGCCLVKS